MSSLITGNLPSFLTCHTRPEKENSRNSGLIGRVCIKCNPTNPVKIDTGVYRKGIFMAQLSVVYWRDIPAQVIVKAGRRSVAKRELSLRFTEAIDICAMRSGLAETNAYLEEWRRGEPVDVGDEIEAEADRAAGGIETKYDQQRLKSLIDAGGRDTEN